MNKTLRPLMAIRLGEAGQAALGEPAGLGSVHGGRRPWVVEGELRARSRVRRAARVLGAACRGARILGRDAR